MIEIQIIPKLANRYMFKAEHDFHTGLNIRLCLETIVDLLFKYLVHEGDNEKLIKYNKCKSLGNKIYFFEDLLPIEIFDTLKYIKDVGNDPSHNGFDTQIDQTDITKCFEGLKTISLWVFIAYFKNFGFASQKWITVVFSSLTPAMRIFVLNEVIKSNDSYLIIRKLALALLKDKKFDKANETIEKYYKNKKLTTAEYRLLKEDLVLLQESFNFLPISNSIEMAAETFFKIESQIPESEVNNFILLMSTVLCGYEDKELN